MEIFDILNAMTHTKEELDFDNDEIRKGYQTFIVNRFLSMSEVLIPLVNEINRYDVPKDVHFRYFHSTLPKKKFYFKYIKKAKDLSADDKIVIANHFQIGLREADEYIKMLEESQLKEILEIYKYGKK